MTSDASAQSPTNPPKLSVVVTTYNRKDELGRCLDAVLSQNFPHELLVLDDASTDGTSDYVAEHYPQVRLERSEENVGLIGQRSRAGKLARGTFMLSIDDDIVLDAPDTLERVVAAFDDPRIAAVTVPSIDVLRDPDHIHQLPPEDNRVFATAVYRGGATAFRRSVFNNLGGYDTRLYRQGEEMDLALRIYNAGYAIVLGRNTPILHYESPRRAHALIFYYKARNAMLFCWWRVPWAKMPMYVGIRTWNLFRNGLRRKFLGATLRGLAGGHLMGICSLRSRAAASPIGFATFESLRRGGIIPLDSLPTTPRDL